MFRSPVVSVTQTTLDEGDADASKDGRERKGKEVGQGTSKP